MPPGMAIDSRRAATLTASPIRSSPLSTTSPRLTPMRRTSWSFGPAVAIGGAHRFLDFQGGADRFDRAREFRQKPVAGQLEDAPAMILHQGLGGGHAVAEQAERMFLVAGRHGAEADDVDVHDRGQAPDEVGFSHGRQASRPPGGQDRPRSVLASAAALCEDRSHAVQGPALLGRLRGRPEVPPGLHQLHRRGNRGLRPRSSIPRASMSMPRRRSSRCSAA